MAYREIPHDDRVKAVREYAESKKLKEIAAKYGISEATILDDYRYILEQADEMLKKNVFTKIRRKMQKLYHLFLQKKRTFK
jgi:hypothetical protein